MSHSGYDPPYSDTLHETLDALVLQAKAGNQASFESLYEKYNSRICLYLTRMVGNDGIGSELTQETFIKVWEALPGLRDDASFTSWIYRIATNVAYSYQKRTQHFQFIPWDTYRENGVEPSLEGPEDAVGETELMKQALALVSPTYRPYLILYVVEGLSQRQIADRLGKKESSVSKYVSRGKEHLRQIYFRLSREHNDALSRRQDR